MRRRSLSLLTLALVLLLTWGHAYVFGQNSPGGSFIPNFNYIVSGQWTWRALTPWVIEGAVDDAYETLVTFTEPTADRTITFQDASYTTIGRDTTDTLTNKTADLASNTLTGTLAQFNTAMSDDNFASLTGTETLTNKTLGGALKFGRTGVAATYTLLSTDHYVELTSWTGALTLNLPASVTTLGTGFTVYIKDGAGLATGSPSGRTVTVNASLPSNGGSIDGSATKTITTAYGVMKLIVGVDNTGNFQWLTLQ